MPPRLTMEEQERRRRENLAFVRAEFPHHRKNLLILKEAIDEMVHLIDVYDYALPFDDVTQMIGDLSSYAFQHGLRDWSDEGPRLM